MLIVSLVLFVVAVVVGGVAVAGMTGRLPRNRWAGVRTPDTLASEESFRLANRIASPGLLTSAFLLAIGGVAALMLGSVPALIVALVAIVTALVTASYGGTAGARAAAAAAPAGCGDACGCGGHAPAEAATTSPCESDADRAAAADCGTDSCGSCALKGSCLPH